MHRRGFTLVEMAIVLAVIGLIILTVFPALTALRSSTQRSTTQSNLQALMRATSAYIQAYGCVPCPMPPNAAPAAYGRVGGTGSACSKAASQCVAEGVPPFASLGLPASMAHDGWGHWISMRVDPSLTVNTSPGPPSSTTGICQIESPFNGISIQISNDDAGNTTQYAAVLFISHGSSGFGSLRVTLGGSQINYIPFPTDFPDCSSGGYAQCNGYNGKYPSSFVDPSLTVQDTAYPYDDVMTYAGRNALVSMLGNVGCSTGWP